MQSNKVYYELTASAFDQAISEDKRSRLFHK